MNRGPLALFLIAAFLLGTASGVLLQESLLADAPVASMVLPPPNERAEKPLELSDEEIESICSALSMSDRERLEVAQSEVGALRSTLEAREMELADLRAQQRRAAEAGERVAARIRALEAEVGQLKTQLEEVTAERDVLLVELKDTVRKLEVQIRETERYKAEAKKWKRKSTENLWKSFVAEAKVALCDRGTAKRHERCHEAVEEALTPALQERFETCVDTYQATPALGQQAKGAELPAFATLLSDDRGFATRGWYVQFCDPTLPEAGGTAEL